MKGCTRTVWKTMLVLFSTFSCLLQGMCRYFKEMCGVNHKRVVYWVNNYTKMKYMLGKHMTPSVVPWYELTVPW